MKRQIIPLGYGLAAAFVQDHHRHSSHAPNARSHQFSLALLNGWRVCAVVMVHRPNNRHQDDGTRWEVARLCSDGTQPNACSQLYAAAFRGATQRGILCLGTYTLETESGASLRGAGWELIGRRRARQWNTAKRARTVRALPSHRLYWEKVAS